MKPDFSSMEPEEVHAFLADSLTKALNEAFSSTPDVPTLLFSQVIQVTLANIGFTGSQFSAKSYLTVSRDGAGVFTAHVTAKPPDGLPDPAAGPPTCDNEVFNWGEHVYTVVGVESQPLEDWVREVVKRSGQRVDWHGVAGRAHIKTIGDLDLVRQAITELEGELYRIGGVGSLIGTARTLPWTLR